jgi:hypothetical protein
MATSTFNAQEIETRRKLLHEELAALEAEKLKNLGAMQVVDYHHPERTPGWPIYNVNDPKNRYPRLLYHPTMKDQRVEDQRLGIRRRNEANPNLALMDVPASQCLTRKVANPAEHAAALQEGFVETPVISGPALDNNSPAELIGRATVNPLPQHQPGLTVETIIKLNQMSKDELVKQAQEVYGVSLPEDASKVDIITAIQQRAEK